MACTNHRQDLSRLLGDGMFAVNPKKTKFLDAVSLGVSRGVARGKTAVELEKMFSRAELS